MIPLVVLRELYDYNYWARDRQLEACKQLTAEQFVRPLGNSFSSVQDTLAHLVGAEWVWQERWRGRSPTPADAQEFAAQKFVSVETVAEKWAGVERAVRDYLIALREEDLTQPLTYLNFKGERWTYPLWRTLLHVVNHQTYHRGQITTMLRQLGAQPVAVDFLVAHDAGLRK